MKKLKILYMLFLIVIIPIQTNNAQIKKVAQAGMQFLKVNPSAHAAAMGGAFSMIGKDASALFLNPAGIAYVQSDFDVFLSQVDWFADIKYSAGAAVVNLGDYGDIGVSFILPDYGEIIGTQVASNEQGYVETGNVSVGAYSVGLAYATSFSDKFSIGAQIKYVDQNLGESMIDTSGTVKNNDAAGFGFDFGTIFYPGFESLRFGITIRNFSGQFQYEETPFQLPLTFIIGAAMDVLDLFGKHDNSFVVSLEALHPRDYTERIHLGGEYTFMDMISLRMGYKFNYDLEGLSAGVGFNKVIYGVGIRLDYSYSDFDIFGSINRLSLGLYF